MFDPTIVTPVLGFPFGALAALAILKRDPISAVAAVCVAFVIAYQFGVFQ